MPKWAKFIIAILLLPLCLGAAQALFLVFRASAGGRGELVWIPLLAGAACWVVVFLMLPKPMWIYVVGHEFTHAIWVWLHGGKVKKFKASSEGGHVVVTKNNFLIGLAPYFFPLYAVLVVLVFAIGTLFANWRQYAVWFHLFIGAAYAFHVTLTFHVLKTRQSDVTQQGYLFSAVVIWLGNIAVLLLGVPLLTERASVLNSLGLVLKCTGDVLQRLSRLI